MLTECESYWQIDVHLMLSPFNLTYPDLPAFPAVPEPKPYPCTDAYIADEYGHLAGSCVPVSVCQPCAESLYHPPEDLAKTVGPPDVEEYLAHSHSRINGDVIKFKSPVKDATECAVECNVLDECKAFRYFTDPEHTCELLSHYQIDDKVHEAFTFSFLKKGDDGKEVVEKAVEEIVFFSFEDQPELPFTQLTFPMIDTNGDGSINAGEYIEFSKNLGLVFFGPEFREKYGASEFDQQWNESAGRAIAALDVNLDGRVDEQEALAGKEIVKEFITIFMAIGGDLGNLPGTPAFLQFPDSEEPSNAAPSTV
jgi:hypothetical protein